MNDDFDFKNIGKRMPYEVPDAFFDDLTKKVITEYGKQKAHRSKIVHLKRWVLAVAAVVVLGAGTWFSFLRNNMMDNPLAYDLKTKENSQIVTKSQKNQPKGKIGERSTEETSKQRIDLKADKSGSKQTQSVKSAKEETLDDALKSLSREELEQLYSAPENDFIYEE